MKIKKSAKRSGIKNIIGEADMKENNENDLVKYIF